MQIANKHDRNINSTQNSHQVTIRFSMRRMPKGQLPSVYLHQQVGSGHSQTILIRLLAELSSSTLEEEKIKPKAWHHLFQAFNKTGINDITLFQMPLLNDWEGKAISKESKSGIHAFYTAYMRTRAYSWIYHHILSLPMGDGPRLPLTIIQDWNQHMPYPSKIKWLEQTYASPITKSSDNPGRQSSVCRGLSVLQPFACTQSELTWCVRRA